MLLRMFEALLQLNTESFACTVNIKIKILHAQKTIVLSENIVAKIMKTGFSNNKIYMYSMKN